MSPSDFEANLAAISEAVEIDIHQAHRLAGQKYLTLFRATLAPFNLRRHKVTIEADSHPGCSTVAVDGETLRHLFSSRDRRFLVIRALAMVDKAVANIPVPIYGQQINKGTP